MTTRLLVLLVLLLLLLLLDSCCCCSSCVAKPHTFDADDTLPVELELRPPSRRLLYFKGLPRSFSRRQRPDTLLDDQLTIFISVASFRDPECPQTLREAFWNAVNPRRVFLGIIEQQEHGDPTCIPPEFRRCLSADFCPIDNVRRRRVVSKRAKGPCYGRYHSMLSYRGESYYMMVDSHTGFIRKWDRRMLINMKKARSPRPVLSHYPHKWLKELPLRREPQSVISSMCNGHYLKELGYIRLDGVMLPRHSEPYASPFAAAGFLFGDARLVHQVPFDPLLDYLFDGEEVLYSTRMWTHGFDMFSPTESFVFHSYGRRNASKYWGFHLEKVRGSSLPRGVYWARRRVQYILKVTEPNSTRPMVPPNITVGRVTWNLAKYGLGRVRSLDAYNRFAKIDPIYRRAPNDFCRWLGRSRGKL